ncbi:MAG: hypothetical protein ABJN36_05965 [Cyclobacteriaceae bacterium]
MIGKKDIGGFEFKMEQEMVSGIDLSSKNSIILDSQTYEPNQALNFAAALNYVTNLENKLGLQYCEGNKEELKFGRLISRAKMPVLVSVLLIFLINGVLFVQFTQTNAKLKERSGTIQILDKKRSLLENYIENNKRFLDNTQGNLEFSIVADRIGAAVPKTIKLTKIVIQPKTGNRAGGSEYLDEYVILEGNSETSQAFSSWIKDLEKDRWVDAIVKQHYEVSNNGKWLGTFHLTIKRRDEKA